MITLLTKSYNKEEFEALAGALTEAENYLMMFCKEKSNCKSCVCRHVCYDIMSAKEHAIKIMTKVNEPQF